MTSNSKEIPWWLISRQLARGHVSTSRKKAAPKAPNPLWFMDLPPEIRIMIYSFAVIAKQSIRLVKDKTPSTFISLNSLSKRPSIEVDDRDRQYLSTCNALLSTSWTINREVMPVFFGENRFEFSSSTVFRKFLKTVPRSCWSLIADITIGNFDRARYDDTHLIARRSPAGKIKVHFNCGSIFSCYDSVQEAAETYVSIGKIQMNGPAREPA